MSDRELERFNDESLASAMPQEVEADLTEHPEFRLLYEDLMPKAGELRTAVGALAERHLRR